MKKLKALIFCFMAILLMPIYANATEVVKVGTEDELRVALESGKSVELIADINITKGSSKFEGRSTGVAIVGEGDITINGNGHKIDTNAVRTTIEIYAIGEGANVTFNNVKVNNGHSKKAGRCIDTRTGNLTLTFNGVTLTTNGTAGNPQVLTIGGNYTGANNINIINSTVSDGISGYAIISYNKVNLTIDNSEIFGYGALYMKGKDNSQGSAGSLVTVRNGSLLSTDNVHSALTNSFATVIFEDKDITMNIQDSTVKAVSTGAQPQYSFIYRSENCKVNFSGKSVIEVDDKEEFVGGKNIILTLNEDVSSNVEFSDIYVADGMEIVVNDGKYFVSEVVVSTELPTVIIDGEVKEVEIGVNASEKTEEVLFDSLNNDVDLTSQYGNTSVTVEVEIDKLEDVAIDKAVVTAIKEKAGKAKVETFFDITVAVKTTNDSKTVGTLDELTEEIELVVLLPEKLKNTDKKINRKYYIVRYHVNEEGKEEVELLDATLSNDGKSLSFKSDKFSTYALAYEDINVIDNPKTSDNIFVYFVFIGISLIGLIGLTLYTKKTILAN